jgi:surfactin synthase thioesterase subunit
VTDNFFDLGGDSFKAIRLIRKLDERVSLLELFTHSTIRELAVRMAAPRPVNTDLLQPLKTPSHSPRVSLVCAPYDGGTVVNYRALAQALPDDYALYAIALPGHDYDRQGEPLKTIEEVAGLCVEEIKRKVTGPLAIYGHSGGVALAVELARQLEAQALEIQTIFLAGALPGTKLSLLTQGMAAQVAQALRPTRDQDLLAYLQSLGAYTDFEGPDELKLMLKCARYDGRLSAEYFRRVIGRGRPARLNAPIACIVADKDRLTQGYETRYSEWTAFSARVSLSIVDDHDHFFVKSRAREVAEIIQQTIGGAPSAPRPAG